MNAWIDVHGTVEERRTLMESLPSLPVGDAWFWSPGWPTADGIFQRAHVLPIETFDSGATPKPGEKRREPKQLADVDLEALRRQMSETIQRAKDNNPAELKKKVTQLERDLKAAQAAQPAAVDEREIERRIKVRVDDETRNLKQQLATRDARIAELAKVADENLRHIVKELGVKFTPGPAPKLPAKNIPVSIPAARPVSSRTVAARDDSGDLGKGERAILTVLAMYPAGKNRRALGTLSGYSSSGGSFGTYISRLRGKGHIEGADTIRITAGGLAALGEFEPLPRGEELQRYWLSRLGKGEAAILAVLLQQYPNAVSRDELGQLSGYEASGGSFATYLSRLRTKELVHERDLRASDAFFE
jgi:hypothetical protein